MESPNSMGTYVKGELREKIFLITPMAKWKSRHFFKKGSLDGKKEDFDDDGILFCETIFERGQLRDVKFLDKKGNSSAITTSRKGNADVSFYNPDGIKVKRWILYQGRTTEGKFTYYFKNGKVSCGRLL